MTTTDKDILEVGGHRTIITGKTGTSSLAELIRRCLDCNLTGAYTLFSVGTRGCPARPESLDYLSVCPGGELCEGHPDTSTPEWRAYSSSNHISLSTVPRLRCDPNLLGVRAARQWISFADKIGMKTSAWAQSSAQYVHGGGGVVAELTANGDFHIIVTRRGNLAAHRGGGYGCAACNRLKETGDLPS